MKTTPLSLITAILLGATSLASAQEIVNIPDAGLEFAIRVALDKPTGDITVEDMESLTELHASPRLLIRSLQGLEAATNLTSLDLSGGSWALVELQDFSLLGELPNLTTLNLSNNDLTRLILPEGLISLTSLDLSGNPITSLSVPMSMNIDNLEVIGFSKEDITFYVPGEIIFIIPDLGLEYAIREALNKPTGGITVEDMESLTELNFNRFDVGNAPPPFAVWRDWKRPEILLHSPLSEAAAASLPWTRPSIWRTFLRWQV